MWKQKHYLWENLQIYKPVSWYFEKTNSIGRSLAKHNKTQKICNARYKLRLKGAHKNDNITVCTFLANKFANFNKMQSNFRKGSLPK